MSRIEALSKPAALRATGLRKTYGKRTVVHDVSLEVAGGEVVGLLGPNGAGKTTSFYMMVGIVPADAGRIEINDVPVTHMPIHQRARLGLSYLPQDASVFRRLTVEENIQAVLELQRDAHGWYTPQIAGTPSMGAGKVQRVQDWLHARGLDWGRVYTTFYSDSRNDLPLLERVNQPVATNPDAVLRAAAHARGWRILDLFAAASTE